jgi:hypothetical protein
MLRVYYFFIYLFFFALGLNARQPDERIIYISRTKQLLGSGNKMNLVLNGELVYKLKSGSRLILTSKSSKILNFQIVYPLMKQYKSEMITIHPEDEQEIYLDARYTGTNQYDFMIEFYKIDPEIGKVIFNQSKGYKRDKIDTIDYKR